ncbi:hypothetical protein PSY40_23155, partial [Shigella flexneri]|nr:hypothetical protein [Shigella flexneri]
TDVEYKGDPKAVKIEESEINYLLKVRVIHFQQVIDFTLFNLHCFRITDVEYKGDPKAVKIEESEINYLLKV